MKKWMFLVCLSGMLLSLSSCSSYYYSTLASNDRSGRYDVNKDFVIDNPRIYAYVDSTGQANWDIVAPSDTLAVTDTVAGDSLSMASGLRIKNVRIRNGNLVFDDRSTQLYTRLTGLNLGVDGYLGLRRSKLKVDFSTENVLFWQEGKLLVNHLALGIETGMKVNRDSLLYTL